MQVVVAQRAEHRGRTSSEGMGLITVKGSSIVAISTSVNPLKNCTTKILI